jgi:hypothetical protein
MRSGKTGVRAIRLTGLQEVQGTDARAHDPLIHTMQRARERSVLFIRKAEAHDLLQRHRAIVCVLWLLTFYRSFGKLDRKGHAYANEQSRT